MADSATGCVAVAGSHRSTLVPILVLVVACSVWAQPGPAKNVLDPIGALAARTIGLLGAGGAASAAAAARAFDQFESLWKPVEDGIRARNLELYARIEVESSRAAAALKAAPPDLVVARQSLEGLGRAVKDYAAGAGVGPASGPAAGPAPGPGSGGTGQKGLSALLTIIRQVKEALASGDVDQAADLMNSFQEIWPLAEADVQTRSKDIYTRIEREITEASALLLSGPGSRDRAADVVGSMLAQLEGLSGRAGYSAWDAGLILLREGLEALLILAALLAALRKAGADPGTSVGTRWVWAGAGTGLLASAVVAVILVFAISAATAGTARETMEGTVGLASVAIMITVGAWLHGRASLQAWQGFIKGKVGTAIAGGRMWSLYALALFAVLREGAEATVFYIGIAQGIGPGQLLAGIGGAIVLLGIVGFLLFKFSVRLPLRWVFLAATLLIYYLAFKITGESVRALQAAAVLPSHFADWLPSVQFLGMTPTWEAFLPQAVVLVLVLAEMIMTETKRAVGGAAGG